MMYKYYYPIVLKLKDKVVLVVGGGEVSERKTEALLQAGADVHVISPILTPRLKRLAEKGKIRRTGRTVRSSDLRSVDVVIAATSDKQVNKQISKWAARRNILVNVVDKPALSNFISPAVLRVSKAVIAVHTYGADPAFSRDLKNFLKGSWDVFLSYRKRLQKSAH